MAAQDHELLMNYFLILVMTPYSIICMIAMFLALQSYLVLWVGFFSVIVLILNVDICILTGVQPGTGLNGMYVIADILTVAIIMFTCLLRHMREDAAEHEHEDD
jgi:hypothetical protein